MSMKEALLAEWDQEMAGTRRALARIPDGKFDWAPHAKSMRLGRLGEHVATMGMWATQICTSDVFDFATAARPALPTTTVEMLATHDQWLAQGRAALVARDASGTVLERRSSWSSSNTAVAMVSSSGLVTAVLSGIVAITATAFAIGPAGISLAQPVITAVVNSATKAAGAPVPITERPTTVTIYPLTVAIVTARGAARSGS